MILTVFLFNPIIQLGARNPIDFRIRLVPRIAWVFLIVSRINDLFSCNNSFLLSAYLNKEDMVWNRKYKALAALNSFLLLAISFNTETSFPERESQPLF